MQVRPRSPGLAALGLLAAALSTAPAFAHDYQAGTLRIDHPWSRVTAAPGATGVVYLTIENTGDTADRLTGAASALAERAELHESVAEDGVMGMRPIEALEIPPGEAVALEPGGRHLMLIGLARRLVEGERIPVTLEFEEAGTLEVESAVQPITSTEPEPAHENH